VCPKPKETSTVAKDKEDGKVTYKGKWFNNPFTMLSIGILTGTAIVYTVRAVREK